MNVDLAITGGRIVDGTGSPAYAADVGIRGNRICHVGTADELNARRTIGAEGMVVCPGFIDMHSHSDLMALAEPGCLAKMMQGVTTEVIGQDGLSYAPVTDESLAFFRTTLRGLNGDPEGLAWDWRSTNEYLDQFDRRSAINIAMLAPHGNIRAAVLGMEDRTPTRSELDRMKQVLDQAMSEGAFGLSTGLTYSPCSYAGVEELVGLCQVVAAHGGYFAPHMRNYGAQMEAAVEEVIEICTRAELPLHLTHFHSSFDTGRGKADNYVARIERARQEGLEVTLDAYPYLAASTFMAGLLPNWSHAGGPERLLARLADPETCGAIRHELEVTGSDGMQGVPAPWDSIILTGLGSDDAEDLIGLSLQDISQRTGLDVSFLEQIESGSLAPPLGIVIKLAKALNLKMGYFISGEEDRAYTIVRKSDRKVVSRYDSKKGEYYGYGYESLAPHKKNRHMEPFLVSLDPAETEEERSTHDGQEFIYVLEGAMEVRLDEEIHILRPGDAIYYDSTVPHLVKCHGDKRTHILAVLYAER